MAIGSNELDVMVPKTLRLLHCMLPKRPLSDLPRDFQYYLFRSVRSIINLSELCYFLFFEADDIKELNCNVVSTSYSFIKKDEKILIGKLPRARK